MFSSFENLLAIFLEEDEVQFSELGGGRKWQVPLFPPTPTSSSSSLVLVLSELELRFVLPSVATQLQLSGPVRESVLCP